MIGMIEPVKYILNYMHYMVLGEVISYRVRIEQGTMYWYIVINDYRHIEEKEFAGIALRNNYWMQPVEIEDMPDEVIKGLVMCLGEIRARDNIIIELKDNGILMDGKHEMFYDEYENQIELCYGNMAKGILARLGKGENNT